MAILNFLNDESDVLACLDKRRGKFMLPSTCFACQENQRSLFEICNFRFKFFFKVFFDCFFLKIEEGKMVDDVLDG